MGAVDNSSSRLSKSVIFSGLVVARRLRPRTHLGRLARRVVEVGDIPGIVRFQLR
jgi:hypothetical protein